MTVRPVLPTLLALAAISAAAGPAPLPLNDTGLESCYDQETPQSCSIAEYPLQDARFGRDAAAANGLLAKVGAGSAGFDYTKIANDGSELPPETGLGDAPGDWACTRDNVTGLVWEVKTDDGGLRDKDWLYTWYYANPADNGGDPGAVGSDTCGGTIGSECNTDAYVTVMNTTTLCGFDNWRMPSAEELVGLAHYGIVAKPGAGTPPTIDGDYFPNTITDAAWYWTRDALAQVDFPIFAWFVAFNDGASNFSSKDVPSAVRVVRDSSVPTAALADVAAPQGTLGCNANPNIVPTTLGAFTNNGDGTVTDARTGLVWDRCLLGQDGGADCAGSAQTYNWQDALLAATALNETGYLGHSDWRLPNLRELRSLVERACLYPSIDTNFFPNAPSAPAVQTSGTNPGVPYTAWTVTFDAGGYTAPFNKNLNQIVRLVRGGTSYAAYDALGPEEVIFQGGFEELPSRPTGR